MVVFKDIPKKKTAKKKMKAPIIWNTNRKDGWKNYYNKSDENEKLDQAAKTSNKNVDEMMMKIEKEMTNMKYVSFGKVSHHNKFGKEQMEVEKCHNEKVEAESNVKKEEADEKLAIALKNLNRRKFEDELESLGREKKKKGKSSAIFNLQQRILGSKKTSLEAVAVEDPESGILVDDPERIKDISLKYCINLLTNRKPNPGYESVIERKLKLHEERMEERIEHDNEELSREQFEAALRAVERKHKDKYKFILNGGKSLQNAIFSLFATVWKEEKSPKFGIILSLFSCGKARTASTALTR